MDGSAGLTLAARFIAGRAEAEAELNKSGLGPLVSQVLVAAERGLISDVSAAVFRLARSCLLLPLAPHMAEVAAAACACIAGLAEEEFQSREAQREWRPPCSRLRHPATSCGSWRSSPETSRSSKLLPTASSGARGLELGKAVML
ncbi:unnamed protein product [Effrenium voratum]|nr:unnamed protein product [Effrenium voratum]